MDRQNANNAIDHFILGSEAGKWEHKYISNDVVPHCDLQNRTIYTPVFPTIVNPSDDKLVRAANEHEVGHARFTPTLDELSEESKSKQNPMRHRLINSLEDLRIERGLKTLSKVFEDDLDSANRHHCEKHLTYFKTGKYQCLNPINETMVALHVNALGFPEVYGMLSPVAKRYFDDALPIYNRWMEADCTSKRGFRTIEKIADEILEKWKETREDMNQNGVGDNNQQNQNQQKNNQQNQQGGQSSDNQNGGESSESNGQDNQQNKKSKSSKSSKSDKSQDGKESEENGSDESQGNESNDSDKSNGKNKSDKSENGDGQDGDGEEDEKDGNKSNKSDKSDKSDSSSSNESDEDGEDGDSDGDGEDGQDGQDSDEDGQENGDGSSSDNGDGQDGEDSDDSSDGNQQSSSGKSNNRSNDGDGEDESETTNAKNPKWKIPHGGGKENKSLEDDFIDNDEEKDEIRAELKRIFDESKKVFGKYIPYTAEDEVIPAKKNQMNFDIAFSSIRGATSKLSSYLQQCLKTLSRNRTIYNYDKGMLNVQRNATNIAKSLTNNIFTKVIKGISLDTSVSILIDESGSCCELAPEFRKIVIAFCEVLERIGIKFEVLGHTCENGGRKLSYTDYSKFSRTSKLVMYEHKNFNERYQAEKYRLGSISAYSCNIDGEALLETFKRNIQQKTQRHIILVFSDGLPNDYGSCSDSLLYKNLTDTVKLCRDNNVEVYAFGIGTDAPKKFYGKDYFVYLESVDEMTDAFFRKTSEIITYGRKK